MAKFTIIADSCCNSFPKMLNSEKIDFHVVPLTVMVGDEELVDDENFNTSELIEKMRASKGAAKSACPSPEAFADVMRSGDNVIVIALSSKLSATHASAVTAAETIKKETPNKKLFVLDTLSACVGLDHILFKLKDIIEGGDLSFDEVTAQIAAYATRTRVRFVLQDVTNLVKNGRMSKILGRLISTAKIKLICGDDGKGEIQKHAMALGHKKALHALCDLPMKDLGFEAGNVGETPITIAHANNEDDANYIKDIFTKFGFKNIKMLVMRGISTLYAADKGLAIAY